VIQATAAVVVVGTGEAMGVMCVGMSGVRGEAMGVVMGEVMGGATGGAKREPGVDEILATKPSTNGPEVWATTLQHREAGISLDPAVLRLNPVVAEAVGRVVVTMAMSN
jgi:hypothetical protein